LVPIDRDGHPSLTAFFNADDAKEEYNARQPADDRAGYHELWSQVLQKLGGYSAEDATDALGVGLPDFDLMIPVFPCVTGVGLGSRTCRG
jgi:hypothetical protein